MIDFHPLYYHEPASDMAELEEPLTCPNCGAESFELMEAEDRDDSCGYHSEVTVCPGCNPRRSNG